MPIEQKRQMQTAIPGPRSTELAARRSAAVPAAVPTVLPLYIERAEGAILVDVDGNQLLDFGSGIGVNNCGHGLPEVAEAVSGQLEAFSHTCFSVTPYEGYVAVAERLNHLAPGSHEKRTALFNSGSEAVENAVKLARHHTGRAAVVAFEHAYHGRTSMALALTHKAVPYKQGFGPLGVEIYRMPMAYPLRWPTGAGRCLDEAFEAFVMGVHTQIGERNVAAVILEPIQGEGGFIIPPDGFLTRVSQWCAMHGIVFIADEVQTGLCRTGDWFACDHEQVAPDLLVTGKALGGGLPLAAVTGRADIMDGVAPGGLGGTFSGNPLACAAATATLDYMATHDLAARARSIGSVMMTRLHALADRFDVIGEVRGRGAMVAIELTVGGGELNPHPALAAAVAKACHQEGLIAMVTGAQRNCIRLLPPLTIGDDLLDDGMQVIEHAFITAN
jgi:4-aminobutyrate aminotransferase / (S)-3-amino-2-methylpropionate transaminase / 5-aminovalerate transaminase